MNKEGKGTGTLHASAAPGLWERCTQCGAWSLNLGKTYCLPWPLQDCSSQCIAADLFCSAVPSWLCLFGVASGCEGVWKPPYCLSKHSHYSVIGKALLCLITPPEDEHGRTTQQLPQVINHGEGQHDRLERPLSKGWQGEG